MRTTVDIQTHVLKRLRDQAHAQGIPFKELLNRVLRLGLAATPEKTGAYVCTTFALGAPLRPLDKALALADSLEDEEIALKFALRR